MAVAALCTAKRDGSRRACFPALLGREATRPGRGPAGEQGQVALALAGRSTVVTRKAVWRVQVRLLSAEASGTESHKR
jgi:hypothetical protein